MTKDEGSADCGEYCEAAGTFGAAPILDNYCKQWPKAMLFPARYTPRNRAKLAACLIGLGDRRLVKLNPDAAKLLGRYRVRTVKDVPDLAGVALWRPAHRDRTMAFDRGDDRADIRAILPAAHCLQNRQAAGAVETARGKGPRRWLSDAGAMNPRRHRAIREGFHPLRETLAT